MAKDERLYARFDIAMDEHPKIMMLSDAGFRALFESTMYSRRQLTDGFLAAGVVKRKWGTEAIAELCANDPEKPSWVATVKEGVPGFRIHDYEKHQTTTADIEAKRIAGRRGGFAKASKNVAPATEVLGQKAGTTPTSPLAITETETETETQKKKSLVQKPAHDYAAEFDGWWQVYPRKQGKADAFKAFKVIRKTVELETLMKGVRAYALLNAGEDKGFLKFPAGWLRGNRWEDEAIAASDSRPARQQSYDCSLHDGYPMPCDRCARDAELPEGNDF